jgi:hypothetical protein
MDSLEERLNQIEENIKMKVDGFIRFRELFPDSFIRDHSNYRSADELLEQGGFKSDKKNGFEAIDETRLDKFIGENTDFESWEAMKRAAGVDHVRKKITV